VIALRARQQRNLLTTLFLAQGVPMLLAGDELGRTQQGNNNAYCQDNEVAWVDWTAVDGPLLEFTRWLIAFRRAHPIFRRRRWFQGRPIRGTVDIGWFKPDGEAMTDEDWDVWHARSLGAFLNGRAIPGKDGRGRSITDASFLLLFNAHSEVVDWTFPNEYGDDWWLVLNTDHLQPETSPQKVVDRVTSPPRSVLVLKTP
jgi:isoamylase